MRMGSETCVTRERSKSMVTMNNLRDIALDSSSVMLAFIKQPVQRLKFDVPLREAFKNDVIPTPLLNLLKYISQEGVTVPDIFRRPGNPSNQKKLIKKLNEGKPVSFAEYNFYTLASVIKKFLLNIPGGIFGKEREEQLLQLSQWDETDGLSQLDAINRLLKTLPQSEQRFLTLLFGVWFRIASHCNLHCMTVEAMAKSVTGSIFVNSATCPATVNTAAHVMEKMIQNFPSSRLFGNDNLQFFRDVTGDAIDSTDRFTPNADPLSGQGQGHTDRVCADNETHEKPEPTNKPINSFYLSSEPFDRTLFTSRSLSRYDALKYRQMALLRQRADWFLTPKSACDAESGEIKKFNFHQPEQNPMSTDCKSYATPNRCDVQSTQEQDNFSGSHMWCYKTQSSISTSQSIITC